MPEDQPNLYPLQFLPVFKDYPWGGRAIGTRLGRSIPAGPVAESWEISGHLDGRTRVSNGRFVGRHLESLQRELGESLVGRWNGQALERSSFPLLIKILDANEWLSVQVHPEDSYALENEDDLGKAEMWIVLEAEPGAEILLGFRPGVDADSFRRAIHNGTVAECLHRTSARTGDVFFLAPGTVHAIGPGVLVAEIQQSSNVTYRVFDWDRRPQRTIHLEPALEVLDFTAIETAAATPEPLAGEDTELLAECPHFRTERVHLRAGQELAGNLEGDSFEIWGAIDGSVTLESGSESVELKKVSWTLLPADLGAFRLQAGEDSTLLRILTPEPV